MGRRILILEDDTAVRDALAGALAASGIDVVLAGDGHEGLARLAEGPAPEVVLLDLRLSRLGGEELLRAIRSDPRFEHLPVITMSAATSAADQDVIARLQDPIDVDDLRAIVLSLCEADAA